MLGDSPGRVLLLLQVNNKNLEKNNVQSNILFCSQTANKLECSISYRNEHQWVEFDTLPPAVVKQESVSAGDEDDDIPDCDRCEKSSKKPAAVYCPDCAEKICTMHQKVLH